MPLEIEAKMKVDDLARVRATLADAGARALGRALETNVFFDTTDHRLLAEDQGLRLRHTRSLDGGGESTVMTFKGPQGASELKQREEIEFTVSDLAAASALLTRLGYHAELTFEKRRESWRLDDCRIELDELPRLGTFVEIEGPGEQSVLNVRRKLGLDERPLIKTSYIAMLAADRARRGSDAREIRFDRP